MNQSINESINRSIDRSIDRSINHAQQRNKQVEVFRVTVTVVNWNRYGSFHIEIKSVLFGDLIIFNMSLS